MAVGNREGLDGRSPPLDDLTGERLSAFPAGLGGEGGEALFDPLSFALRTGNLGRFMLRNGQNYGKFLIAPFAFILVCRHFNPPLSRYALIGIIGLSYLNELEYIVKKGNVHSLPDLFSLTFFWSALIV
jgi:hypothetical protein